jgi:DNA topoisomerase VI subunit A
VFHHAAAALVLLNDSCESIIYVLCSQGKGYPDVNTRRFLRRLWDELQLPPLALVDADPHGISILAVYRFGSQVCEHGTLKVLSGMRVQCHFNVATKFLLPFPTHTHPPYPE